MVSSSTLLAALPTVRAPTITQSESSGRKPSFPPEAGPPAAMVGTLESTPVPQLLLTILTRMYSGSLLLRANGETEIVLFARGAPTCIVPARPLMPIGEMLVTLGVLRRDDLVRALTACRASGARLGEEIARDGRVAPEIVDWVVRAQLLSRVRALMDLPRETTFEFHLDANLLQECDVSEESVPCDPLEIVLTATRFFRDHGRMDEGLLRLGDRPIRLHPRARPDRFGLTDTEQAVVDRLRAEPPVSLAELRMEGLAPEKTLRSLLYALTFTRHLDLGVVDAWPALVVRGPAMEIAEVSAPTTRGRRVVALAATAGSLTHYELLDVESTASPRQIEAAVAALLPLADPATLPPRMSALDPVAQRLLGRISRARETLLDPARRAEYDAVLARQTSAPDPDPPEAALAALESYRKAEALVRSGDLMGAEQLAARATELDPEADTLALLGWIRGSLAATKETRAAALGLMGRALELDPDSDRALVYRAMLQRRFGDEAAALRDFERAIELNPANVDAARGARSSRSSALPGEPRAAAPPAPTKKRRSPLWLALSGLVALAAVVATLGLGGRTNEAQTREDLMAFGLERELQGVQDTQATEHEALLQGRGGLAAARIVKLLGDTHRVEDGHGRFTERTVQAVANEYLLRYAARAHHEPPTLAAELARDLSKGGAPTAAQWGALEAAWTAYLQAN